MKRNIIAYLALIVLMMTHISVSAQVIEEDVNAVSSASVDSSEYLAVSVIGNGSVTFTMPEEVTVAGNGVQPVYERLSTRYGSVPGIGVLVTFKTSRPASVSTSDNQNFGTVAGEFSQIMIPFTSSPSITIRFSN